jgi:SAM-dependent methyltransferase
VSTPDPDTQRLEMLDRWDRAAVGWRKRADEVRDSGMPVSIRMIEHLGLHPGLRVLELAAGPGDTGFLASELITPGGTLISSDGTAAMLDVARDRAGQLGVTNVEFQQLNLEWIDLETASVDRVLCRWGFMLILDPSAAARETRRVLRPGGRLAIAVWDEAAKNPWATIPGRALIARGLAEPPDPRAPGMFTLAGDGAVQELLEDAGFVDVTVEAVEIERVYPSVDAYLHETRDLSMMYADAIDSASDEEQVAVGSLIADALAPVTRSDGSLLIPGSSLVAAANA